MQLLRAKVLRMPPRVLMDELDQWRVRRRLPHLHPLGVTPIFASSLGRLRTTSFPVPNQSRSQQRGYATGRSWCRKNA